MLGSARLTTRPSSKPSRPQAHIKLAMDCPVCKGSCSCGDDCKCGSSCTCCPKAAAGSTCAKCVCEKCKDGCACPKGACDCGAVCTCCKV